MRKRKWKHLNISSVIAQRAQKESNTLRALQTLQTVKTLWAYTEMITDCHMKKVHRGYNVNLCFRNTDYFIMEFCCIPDCPVEDPTSTYGNRNIRRRSENE